MTDSAASPATTPTPVVSTVAWQAAWIGTGEDGPVAPLFRHEFTVPDDVTSARLHIAGLGLHRTTVDGQPVTDARLESGLTAYDKTVLFSSYDLGLTPGAHVLGVELGRGFYAMTTENVWFWEKAPWRGPRKLLAQLELARADGSTTTITSGTDWRWIAGPTRFDSYYEGETYDAREEPAGWDRPGFDDSGWNTAVAADAAVGRLAPRVHEPVRVVSEHPVVTWLGGGDRPLVADFGEMLAGWVRVEGKLPEGTQLNLTFGERLEEDGGVLATNQHVLSERFDRDEVIFGAGPLSWERRFGYVGFRYVEVDGLPEGAEVSLTGLMAHNDVTEISTFSCGNDILTWLDHVMRRTVANNLHHVPTDTPVYEKNGWTGDAHVSADAMLAEYDLHRLFAKWLDDMADAQIPEGQDRAGLIPVIVPSAGWGYEQLAPAPEWTTLYPYLLDCLVLWYGDTDVVTRHLDPVIRYLDYELGRIDADGLTYGVLGDYLTPGSHGTPPFDDLRIAASCYLYRGLRLTADLAQRYGNPAQAARADDLRAGADSLAAALNAMFFDDEQGCYRSEREPEYRQTSNVLPVAFGITPQDQVQRVVDRLAVDIAEHDDHHNAGCLGLSQLFGVLTDHGHADVAVRVATQTTPPSWGAWLRAGETTLREMWGEQSRSHNHYFMGAASRWLYERVAGVRVLAPGWTEFEVKPLARQGIGHASFSLRSPLGQLGAAWQEADGVLKLSVTVPEGSRAQVTLPDREPFWAEPGTWTYEAQA